MGGLTAARLSTDGRVKEVRRDHTQRYKWAAGRTQGHVIDAGCNCGYGAAILADAGRTVTAMDNWVPGLEYAREHWDRPTIAWIQADFETSLEFSLAYAVIAFELIEHLENPRPLLKEARRVAPWLLASVPNEDVWPWEPRLGPVHKRHYTRDQFEALLIECGWLGHCWWGQADGYSSVGLGAHGRTLVVECH